MVSVHHMLFLHMCDVILLKGNMNNPSKWLLARFVFRVKYLESASDPQLLLVKAIFFILYEMACVFKARISLQSNPNCNLKEVTTFFLIVVFVFFFPVIVV